MCTDGLTEMVAEDRIAQVLNETPDLCAAGTALIDEANKNGGRDNVTVILARFSDC